MPFVEIEYLPDGSKKVEAVGFQGSACEEATRPFETNKVTEKQFKLEYYDADGVTVRLDNLCG